MFCNHGVDKHEDGYCPGRPRANCPDCGHDLWEDSVGHHQRNYCPKLKCSGGCGTELGDNIHSFDYGYVGNRLGHWCLACRKAGGYKFAVTVL